jgi:hypothetical protein
VERHLDHLATLLVPVDAVDADHYTLLRSSAVRYLAQLVEKKARVLADSAS